jgi:biotin carboxylase
VRIAVRRIVRAGIQSYYASKIEELEVIVRDKTQNLRRLEAQRNELNSKGASRLAQRVRARTRGWQSYAALPPVRPVARSRG